MSVLQDFLVDNANVALEEQEVFVSNRFKDGKGNILKFKIKPVTHEQFSEYQKKCTNVEFVGKKRKMELDSGKFNSMVIINHTVDPNFKDSEFLKKVTAITPEQALSKLLLAGEVTELAQRISDISGFDTDINEEIEEAKN